MPDPSQEPTPQTTGRSIVVFGDDVRGDRNAILEALRALAELTASSSPRTPAAGRWGPTSSTAPRRSASARSAWRSSRARRRSCRRRSPTRRRRACRSSRSSPSACSTRSPSRSQEPVEEEPGTTGEFADDDEFTWGLRATGVDVTQATGEGIKIAVLDTGFTVDHPDFAGRTVTTQSFITGQAVDDGHGHGTHCIGTAAGPAKPPEGRRYGIATGAEIFAGKVLSNAGSGADAGHPRGDRVGDHERLPGRLDVARRERPRAVGDVRGGRPPRARRGHVDRRRRGQQRQPPGQSGLRRDPRQQRLDHGRRRARLVAAARRVLGRQRHAEGRGGRHRGPGGRRLLDLAHAAALQHRSPARAWRRRTSPASRRCGRRRRATPARRCGRRRRRRAQARAARRDVGAGLAQAPPPGQEPPPTQSRRRPEPPPPSRRPPSRLRRPSRRRAEPPPPPSRPAGRAAPAAPSRRRRPSRPLRRRTERWRRWIRRGRAPSP